MEYVLAQLRPLAAWRKADIFGRLFISVILYTGIIFNPYEGFAAAVWWLTICLGCAALAWLRSYRILGFLCLYLVLPVFAGSGYGFFRTFGLAP